MGQVCDADREIIEAEERQGQNLDLTMTKPIVVAAAPPVEQVVLMAAPAEDEKKKDGVKSRAVLLQGELKLSEAVQKCLNELGPFNLSRSFTSIQYLDDYETYQLDNGIQYTGEWKGEDIHGRGAFLMPDGSYLEAIVVQNEVVGIGRLISPNGDYYEGEFRNNRAHGHGKYRQGKVVLQGEFEDNLPHGGAIEIGQNFRFIGSYEMGSRGQGKLMWRDELGNFTYSGPFQDNLFSGLGSLQDERQSVTGHFKCGRMQLQKQLSKKVSYSG